MTMKKLSSFILNTTVLLILLGVGGLLLMSKLQIPGAVEVKIVKSGSMEPSIHTGGLVFVRPAPTYAVGDVITFGADTSTRIPTTHRIASMREEEGETLYSTKGDANEEVDAGETAADAVIGKVVFSMPYAGYILDFAKQPLGFALLVALPAALVIGYELVAVWNELRTMARNKRRQAHTLTLTERSVPGKMPHQAPHALEETVWSSVLDLRRDL
jgi:signal peptidase